MKAIDLTLLASVTNNLSHYITKIHLNRTDQTDWTFCTCKEQKKLGNHFHKGGSREQKSYPVTKVNYTYKI